MFENSFERSVFNSSRCIKCQVFPTSIQKRASHNFGGKLFHSFVNATISCELKEMPNQKAVIGIHQNHKHHLHR